jgi:hypothetical protein
LATVLVAWSAVPAQRLRGVVRDSLTREPVGGAVLTVSDSAGRFLARGVANAAGEFAVFRLDGSARLSVVRIGYEPRALVLQPSDTVVVIVMHQIPASLSVVTRTTRRVCPTDKGDSQALALWEQARAGLLGALIARESSSPRVDLVAFDRELEPIRKRLRSEHHETKSLTADQPYIAARSAGAFADDGYIVDGPGGRSYFAPDENVLLHESFVATHCLRVVAGEREHAGDIGIGFEPADLEGRDTLVDVSGVLWISRTNPALKSVDFEYTRLEPEAKGSGGQLVFQMMPTGTAIIVRWVLRYPTLVADPPRDLSGIRRRPPTRENRTDVRVVAYHETGGEVGAVEWPDGMKWRGSLSRVLGVVVDSVGHPVGGAAVLIGALQRRDTVFAADDGRFRSAFLASGVFAALAVESVFVDYPLPRPQLIGLRLPPGDTDIEIAIQPHRILLPFLCARQSYSPGLGIILGHAIHADGSPATELDVTVSWSANEGREVNRSGRTNDEGRFVVCGVPPHQSVRLRATTRRESADLVVDVGDRDVIPARLTLRR